MSVEIYFLGAGKPSSGKKPSALKNIVLDTKALDWQLHSFEDCCQKDNIFFLGGYQVEEIADEYPDLNFSIIPDWQKTTSLNTLLHAPLTGDEVLISYTDTLFRKEFINKLFLNKSQVSIVIDSKWRERYSSRSADDISRAETLIVGNQEVEFTGLVFLGLEAVSELNKVRESGSIDDIGSNFIDIIDFYQKAGLKINFEDIRGDWAELNSPSDVANFILGTKSETLARLEPIVQESCIGKQESFTTLEWKKSNSKIISSIQSKFGNTKLIVRSSSKSEDNWSSSNAGGFESILNVPSMNKNELMLAIQKVVDSYGDNSSDNDQILIQEFLQDVLMAGVIFTCTLESGAPYYRCNFDDTSNSTDSVTSGNHNDLRTIIISKLDPQSISKIAPELEAVLKAVQELELILNFDKLDVEFAVDKKGQVHIFQVRPVVVNHENYELDIKKIKDSINLNENRFIDYQISHPIIGGQRTIFANMPDWNPAEIISTRPKPLALSLYQELITNEVWAAQRAEFGYCDVRPYPLIVAFSGQPYVDVRLSLNSFIPTTVSNQARERIVNAYLSILSDNPHYHDKLEFDVAFTIWTPNLLEIASARLEPYGVSKSDISELESGLKEITKNALLRLKSDIESVQTLKNRFVKVCDSDVSYLDKIIVLINDCKRFGTKAFSHAARAGFVATTFLRNLVDMEYLSEARMMEFLNSFETVAGEFESDRNRYHNNLLAEEELIEKYGHLRPGTYEITTQAYWEDKERFMLNGNAGMKENSLNKRIFKFTKEELKGVNKIIEELGSNITEKDFIQYLIEATQQRENVKFIFTRNLSKALDLCIQFGKNIGLDRKDLSFLTFNDLESLKLNVLSINSLQEIIQSRKEEYQLTKLIELPALIEDPSQFYCFERYSSQPNFVGVGRVIGDVALLDNSKTENLTGKIVMIPQADPGYDWLFGHDIAGLITKYGGSNSHMAIRSAEIGILAAIGVGDKLYDSLSRVDRVELDCTGNILRAIN